MTELLEHYGELLREVDRWFADCVAEYGEHIACSRGCSECCRGLFDITALDALFLRSGIDRLPADARDNVRQKAVARLEQLSTRFPAFTPPWFLNHIPESEWDAIMPDDDETPCVLLSEQGSCLVYDYRPMTCRLHGIPMIDTSGEELFDEWCSLNFANIDPCLLEKIRHPFRELFSQELLLFHELTRQLTGAAISELDTLIPAAVLIDADMIAGYAALMPEMPDDTP